MFKVVWKSFKYNRKNFLSFFMSEILSVAVIFMLIYIQEALSQVPGIKTEALQFAYQSELRKQLRIIIPCIILIMILVTGYSVKAYINTRIRDYKLFQLLGIRKKNLKVMIGLEYVISGKHILAWNDCYCYIKKHGFRMLMQILLGIILIFNTFLMLRGTIHDRYMPNDFVCIGNSKETTAVTTVVTARFNGLTKQFPFLWFNEMRGDSWVAISLSDYNKIYNKNESLNKNEIIRIWRKEGSRKSDLSDKQHRKIKSIALGKCGNTDEEGLEYKYNFQIKKEQIKEMIGFSMTGLVIIPDNIFTQAEKESDYKKIFMIINVPKKNLTVSTRYIEEKLQQGKLDEAFCKLTIQGIDKKENVLNQMVVILVAIIILIFTMFITWLMLQNDQEHLKQKYQLGAILGMKRKEGYLSVVKEISRDMWWSLLLAIGISGMFCGVFIKSYYYGTTEIVLIQKEVAMLGCILCIYGIIFMIFIIFSTRRLWKEISKIWGDKN